MGSTAVEKTEEEPLQEINELLPQQRQISEPHRSPPGFERGGLSDAGPRNFAANVARQSGLVRPITERLRSPPGFERGGLSAAGPCNFAANVACQGDLVRPFEADGNEAEDHPPAKRRLLSGVVKVEDGETIENDADKEQLAEEGNIKLGNVSDKRPSNIQQGGWSRRDGTPREVKKENETLLTEHMPRVLPKNEGPSLVSINKRMHEQLLGTLETVLFPNLESMAHDHIIKCLALFEIMKGQLDLMMMVLLICLYIYTKKRRRSENARGSKALTVPNRAANIDRILHEGDRNTQWDIRMDSNAFTLLCEMLQVNGGLTNTGHVPIEEKVLIFLRILAQNESNRVLQVRFMRSGETISRVFHSVLKAVIKLQHLLLVKPIPVPEDCTDTRWKWFKGCLGALDGTYLDIIVPHADKPRYRGRKGRICTNVLGVCDKNLNFVYVLAGWEGSAADSRVLHDAVSRPNGLQVPRGNYYLVDAGYTNGPGFLAPFRGTRYHIQEWARDGRAPRNPEELFNKRHASARNVIERAFGLLKKRWKILRNPSFYPASTHVHIIIACCLLHNFIRLHMSFDPAELADMEPEEMPIGEDATLSEFFDRVETSNEWSQWRAELANNMFDEWRRNH